MRMAGGVPANGVQHGSKPVAARWTQVLIKPSAVTKLGSVARISAGLLPL